MTELKTPADALTDLAAAAPDRVLLHQPLDGEVRTWSRAAALNDAKRLANGLRGLGLEPGGGADLPDGRWRYHSLRDGTQRRESDHHRSTRQPRRR